MLAQPFFRRPFYRSTAVKITRTAQTRLLIRCETSSRSLSSSRSASIVVNIENSSKQKNGLRRTEPHHAHDYSVNEASSSKTLTALLENAIVRKDAVQALACFNQLVTPPNGLVSQKLAILLAKQQSKSQAKKAYDILQRFFSLPNFGPCDYTHLATIFVVDACVQHDLLSEAMDILKRAEQWNLTLDLPAYDRLVQAMVAADKLDEAQQLIEKVVRHQYVQLPERSFQPLLVKMMHVGKYDTVISIIGLARQHGVLFTYETYDDLIEIAEGVDDSKDEVLWETLDTFMAYINHALEEDGITDYREMDDDEDETGSIEVEYVDDDDDDEDDDFDEHHEY